MENFIETNEYHLTQKEENESIKDINNLLKNFEALLKLNSFEMNSRKILDASLICESMLNLLLKRNGYILKNNTSFSQIIIFCTNNEILPVECSKFIDIIRIYRDNVVHGLNTPYELTSSFLDAFVFYISWFNNYYTQNYNPREEIKIKKCCLLINSKDKNYRFNSVDEKIELEKNYNANLFKTPRYCPKCKREIYDEDSKFCMHCGAEIKPKMKSKYTENIQTHLDQLNQELILEQLRKQNESLKEILKTVLETQQMVEDINSKINIITNNLTRIQSLSEKLIKSAWSEEEIDRIIQVHTSECVESILEYHSDIKKDEDYDNEKDKLIRNFGDTWNKLSDESKNLLITSKFMFNKLEKIDENMDYSGICVLVTKALEVEIFDRFFKDFLNYLNERYHDNYSEYHTALLFQYRKPLYPERFTMGNIAFVLCYTENYNDTSEQKQNNKLKLLKYCKSCIFSRKTDEEIEELLNSYASSIEDIRVRFRNPSAHRGYIKKTTAEECFKIVIDVERLLVKMLDSFDY